MKKEFILGIFILIIMIGYFTIRDGNSEVQYQHIKTDINNDIKSNMSKSEIINIIEVNCQNMEIDSDVYKCILRYDIEK